MTENKNPSNNESVEQKRRKRDIRILSLSAILINLKKGKKTKILMISNRKA